MLKILASQNLKTQASKTLKTIFDACDTMQNKPTAFISRELRSKDFLEITEKKEEHLVYDFSEETKNGQFLNATISLPLKSFLFLDLEDKSLHQNPKNLLDIQDIRRMIIPLKFKYNVKDIYIDNVHKVNVKALQSFENEEFKTEYILAIFFYMSQKFNLNFHIGMELLSDVPKPKFIKHLTYGNSYDLIDEFGYN